MVGYEELGKAIEGAIRRVCGGKRVGIAFSGGLDSGLVAALASRYARSVTCYTCGTDGSFDVEAGRELILATGVSDPLTISYELQLFTVCRQAGERIILTGQGSDEYFGGCASSVNDNDSEYEAFTEWGRERLMKVSIPCEQTIAKHFGKRIAYVYTDEEVVRQVMGIDPEVLRPRSLEDRKAVLKEIASDLGFPLLAHRVKKASQYGSGTTDLIRDAARAKGLRYNKYIAQIYEGLGLRNANLLRDSAVDVRMDPILVHDAEAVLEKMGMTHSEAMAAFYRRMVKDGNIGFLVDR